MALQQHTETIYYFSKPILFVALNMTTAPYGSTILWAEPSWYTGHPSPYYKDGHRRLRDYVRKWTEEHFAGKTEEWDVAGKIPDEVYQECAKACLSDW